MKKLSLGAAMVEMEVLTIQDSLFAGSKVGRIVVQITMELVGLYHMSVNSLSSMIET